MPPINGEEWKHVTIVEEKAEHPKVKCTYCSKEFVGGAARICAHFTGGGGMLAHVSRCRKVPECVVETLRQQVGQKQEVAINRQKTSDFAVATRDPIARPDTGRGAGPVQQATVSGFLPLRQVPRKQQTGPLPSSFMRPGRYARQHKFQRGSKSNRCL